MLGSFKPDCFKNLNSFKVLFYKTLYVYLTALIFLKSELFPDFNTFFLTSYGKVPMQCFLYVSL